MSVSPQEPTTLPHRNLLDGKFVFLSASFPSRERAPRYYESADPDEITQAIVAACRAVLSANGRLVFGGHPTVTPLVMMVAEEYLPRSVEERLQIREQNQTLVTAYQLESFRPVLPVSTRRLDEWGLGRLCWIEPGEAERPRFSPAGTLVHGSAQEGLHLMRERMLAETQAAAGIFIGGMEGIHDEARLFREVLPGRPLYFIGAPGGAARELAAEGPTSFTENADLTRLDLLRNRSYPALLQRVVADIAAGR